MPASSYENHEPIFEDFFRIKSAGSSNYRGATFSPQSKNKKTFIRLMRRWIRQIRALELSGEKNRLGRGSDLGHVGGNLCLWGPERFFSVVRNADCTYSQLSFRFLSHFIIRNSLFDTEGSPVENSIFTPCQSCVLSLVS